MSDKTEQTGEQKSFFDKLGEILNSPLPGTTPSSASANKPGKTDLNKELNSTAEQNSELNKKARTQMDDASESRDNDSLLDRIRDILNTPLPGTSETAVQKETPMVDESTPLEAQLPELNEQDFQENWWETDWAEFKAHQERDRKGFSMKQRMDQEGFARYQEQERLKFEAFQSKEFELFQSQQQAKLYWIQNQQLAAAAGVHPVPNGMVPPPPPVAPMPPKMPLPPWARRRS